MISTLLLSVVFEFILTGLVWAGMVVLNLWIWQKSKANSSLLMLIGSALIAVPSLMQGLTINFGGILWLWLFGSICVLAGFYMSVKPMVAAQLAALQAKVKHAASNVTHKDGGGTTPPPPAAK